MLSVLLWNRNKKYLQRPKESDIWYSFFENTEVLGKSELDGENIIGFIWIMKERIVCTKIMKNLLFDYEKWIFKGHVKGVGKYSPNKLIAKNFEKSECHDDF